MSSVNRSLSLKIVYGTLASNSLNFKPGVRILISCIVTNAWVVLEVKNQDAHQYPFWPQLLHCIDVCGIHRGEALISMIMSERPSGSFKYVHSGPCHSLPAWRCLKTWYGSTKLFHACKGVCLLGIIWRLDIQWIYPMHAGEYRPCHSVPTRRCLKTWLGTMKHTPGMQWFHRITWPNRMSNGRESSEVASNQNYNILPFQGPLLMILFQGPHLITQCPCCFDVHSWCCVIDSSPKEDRQRCFFENEWFYHLTSFFF